MTTNVTSQMVEGCMSTPSLESGFDKLPGFDSGPIFRQFHPTSNLRWRVHPASNSAHSIKTLEQLWQGEEGKSEWREVPTV